MRRLVTSKRLLALIALLLLASTFLKDGAAAAIGDPLDRAINRTLLPPFTHPLQAFAAAVRGGGAEDAAARKDAEVLARENDELWRRNRQLEEQLDKARETLRQLSQLPAELRKPDTELMVAAVTAWDPRVPSLTINRGERDGLRAGLIVTDGVHLVGQVAAVSHATSTVRLMTAPKTYVGVRIVPPGSVVAERSYTTIAESLPGGRGWSVPIGPSTPIEVGDLAYVYDDPRLSLAAGTLVGRVADVQRTPTEPPFEPRAILAPQADAAGLSRVIVLVPR